MPRRIDSSRLTLPALWVLLLPALAAGETHDLDADLAEFSGLARSTAQSGSYWAHNDSGNANALYRIDSAGQRQERVALGGAPLFDWEDLAPFRWRGEAALLVADVGDNFGIREAVTLYAVRDPAGGRDPALLWSLELRYPDGARDCEAVAVDLRRGEILLATKSDHPPRVYRTALPQVAPPPPATLEFAGTVGGIMRPGWRARLAAPLRTLHHGHPTALDFSPDGRRAAVLTPDAVYLFENPQDLPWGRALGGSPRRLALPALPQAEALSFTPDGRALWVGSEGDPPRLARVPLPPTRDPRAR